MKDLRRGIYFVLMAAILISTVSSNAYALCNPVDPLNCIAEYIFDNDGIVSPDVYEMRYRYDEYDQDAPFFQWWYYTIKDYDTNTEFALDYSQSFGPQDASNNGTYIMFSMVKTDSNTKFHKYERWETDDMAVANNGQPGFKIQIPVGNDPEYKVDFLGNGTYHLTGKMIDPSRVWFADGTLDGAAIAPGMEIEWDLMIYRIYGWYGQPDFEPQLKDNGVISWNTYAHTSEVEGTITVNGVVYEFERTPRYRAYCDMNWGENFPAGLACEDAIDYPWGWYYANLPDADPNNELGIIAGIGRHHASDNLNGISEGKFADIRLPQGEHVGVRQMNIWKLTPDDDGYTLVGTASDGELLDYSVDRSDWSTYTDAVGSAQIPYRQIVTILTTTKRVTMDFQSGPENYNRLLFPHQDYVFSDFEALGVTCTVKIERRWFHSWDVGEWFPQYTTEHYFVTDDAGLEYGYDTSESNNPGVFD